MRHRKRGRKLKRTASHRRALLAALSAALIRHKRIRTTVAKAKETRRVVEKLITRARKSSAAGQDGGSRSVHARRIVFRFLRDREAVTTLFGEVAEKVRDRPGGYTRVVRLGRRRGDGAELAVLELVDYGVGETPAPKKPEKQKKQAQKSAVAADEKPKRGRKKR